MRLLLALLMTLNAALFVFGAIQHVGIEIGRFREPVIIPAAIVETICALSLLWGLWIILRNSTSLWAGALIGNLIPIAGVLLGMVALAHGRGPRTASNDHLHIAMLTLAGLSLAVFFVARLFPTLGRS
jgi:hypothetical protein